MAKNASYHPKKMQVIYHKCATLQQKKRRQVIDQRIKVIDLKNARYRQKKCKLLQKKRCKSSTEKASHQAKTSLSHRSKKKNSSHRPKE